MRILQIHNKIPFPPKDGGSIAVFNFSEGFAKAENKVDILAFNTNKHFVDIESLKSELPKNINIIGVDIDTDISPVKALKNLLLSKLPYNAERFINNSFKLKLQELLEKNNYDIIQIEGLYMMPYIDVIRKYSKAKLAFRAHNIEYEIWEQTLKQEKNFLKKTYLKIISKRMRQFELSFINKYDFLIPITQRDAGIFKTLGNNKRTLVCPTGLDASRYKGEERNFDNVKLFHLGSLDWTPNQEGLIWFLENIWKVITEQNSNLTFSIAGRNAPEWLINKFKEYKNIIYLGEIDDAIEFMHNHDIMIVPLLSGSGMRIKIIEGMASGNIILSTNKGAEGINGINGKDFILANTENEFINQIQAIANKKKQLKEISINAQEFILNNFDNFVISKSLLEFYQN